LSTIGHSRLSDAILSLRPGATGCQGHGSSFRPRPRGGGPRGPIFPLSSSDRSFGGTDAGHRTAIAGSTWSAPATPRCGRG